MTKAKKVTSERSSFKCTFFASVTIAASGASEIKCPNAWYSEALKLHCSHVTLDGFENNKGQCIQKEKKRR